MSLASLLLGVVNVAIVVAVLLLVGALILWFMGWMGMAVPEMVRKLFLGVVALISLYLLAALILGAPALRIIGP